MSGRLRRFPRRVRPGWSDRVGLAQQVFGLQVLVVAVTVVVTMGAEAVVARQQVDGAAGQQVLSLANAIATMPEVAAGLASDDPASSLAGLGEQLRVSSEVSFVYLMSPGGTRYSHPEPEQIGQTYRGTIGPAVEGGTVVEVYEGTMGPSIRAVVPVWGESDSLLGLVAVGVTLGGVAATLAEYLPMLLTGGLVALGLAAAGSWAVAARLRRQTFGLSPQELAREHLHHKAVFHAVKEGLLVADDVRRVRILNEEARRLLDLGEVADGTPLDELPIQDTLRGLLRSGSTVRDELHLAGERLLVVTQVPLTGREGESIGTVATMRDYTEVAALQGELGAVRTLADSLHAQAHESANLLHTVITLVERGETDTAVQLATCEARSVQAVTDRLVGRIDEPVLVALLLGKASAAHGRGVELLVTPDSTIGPTGLDPAALVTIVGNLIDNAIDATLASADEARSVEVMVRASDGAVRIEVHDTGSGFDPHQRADLFTTGWSMKAAEPGRRHPRGLGLALVSQVVGRLGGEVWLSGRTDGGQGTTAHVVLPLPPATAASPASVAQDGTPT